MNHAEAYSELDAVAFDLLDIPERNVVLAHVSGCDECRAELDRRRAIVADLAFAAPLAADSASGGRARIRHRLTSRAAADIQIRRLTTPLVFPAVPAVPAIPTEPSTFTSGPLDRVPWIALAASVIFIATLGVLAMLARDRDQLRTSLDSLTIANFSSDRVRDSLTAVVAGRDSLLSGIRARDVTMLTLTAANAEPYGRMFWDRARGHWTFVAHHMPPLNPGRTYQLWIVTSKAKISAGTFQPLDGEAKVIAQLALADPLAAVAVTEEPAGGVLQPTGPTVIAATNPR